MNREKPIRASARVLREHKRLLLLPALAGVVQAVVIGTLVALEASSWATSGATTGRIALGIVGLVAVALIGTFFNAVLILAADEALQGRPVRIGSSSALATRRLPAITGWALISVLMSAFGTLLDRVPLLGPVLEKLFGIGWAAATYLVLPAMVIDGLGVRGATRSARQTLGRSGGRIVRGSIWIWMPVVLSLLPTLALLILGVGSDDRLLAAVTVAAAGLWLAVAATVSAGLSGVFRTRLYREVRVQPA